MQVVPSTVPLRFVLADCITFSTTKGKYGALTNMAAGYPILMGDNVIRTVEHLYQALRFPDRPELQRQVIQEHSPMGAKILAHTRLHDSRADWDHVRVPIMAWCVKLKLLNNPSKFGTVLQSIAGLQDVVEISKRDDFWGAIIQGDGTAVGKNTLGRVLWALAREPQPILVEPATSIADLRLFGQDAVLLATAGLTK